MIKSSHLLIPHSPQHHATLLKGCLFALSAPLISCNTKTHESYICVASSRQAFGEHTRHEKGGRKHNNKPDTTRFVFDHISSLCG